MTEDGRDPDRKLVLVVDDEPDVRRYQAAILEDAGFEVDTAGDADEALACVDRRPPDLVSLDLVMPGKSGIKFLHALRRKRDLAAVPVIIVTGHAHDDHGRRQLRYIDSQRMISGPQVFLEKPVRPADYVKAVRERLGLAGREEPGAGPEVSPLRAEVEALLDRADPATLERVRDLLRGNGAPDPAPGGPRALVVDDEPDVAATIAAMLEDDGYVTARVTDPRSALARAREFRPELITLDVDMPGKSGVELYAELRADPDLRGVPVIVVTGVEEDVRPRFAALEGVPAIDGCLRKPLDPERLREAARAARSKA